MKTTLSNIFVFLYLAGTLWVRLWVEPQFKGHYILSIAFGLFALIFLWALIRSKIISPTVFGLHVFIPGKDKPSNTP